MNGVGVGVGLRVGGIGVQVGRALVAVGLGLEVGVTVGVAVTRTTQGVAVASETCASLTFILASTVASMSVLEQAISARETNVVIPIEDR